LLLVQHGRGCYQHLAVSFATFVAEYTGGYEVALRRRRLRERKSMPGVASQATADCIRKLFLPRHGPNKAPVVVGSGQFWASPLLVRRIAAQLLLQRLARGRRVRAKCRLVSIG
jgi:hypothetical protein